MQVQGIKRNEVRSERKSIPFMVRGLGGETGGI